MTVRTAVAGGGNWTAAATWSPSGTPLAGDDCKLDATSGPVTIDSGAVARSLDCTGYVGTLTHTSGVVLNLGDATAGVGNVALKLVAGMVYSVASSSSGITYKSTSTTQQTIITAGKVMGLSTINGSGSSYILGDAWTSINANVTFELAVGTFNTGNFAMSIGLFAITGASVKVLTLGSSAITITGNAAAAINYSGSNCTFTANTAVITLSGFSAGISGGAWNGASVVYTTAVNNASLTNAPTGLNNVTYTGPANKTSSFAFTAVVTFTGTLTVTGNSTTNRLLVLSSVVGTPRTVTAAAVSLSNVDFMDIAAAGASIPWTGTSMGNALGNSNITFDVPTTQSRSGAGGNWSTAGNWTSRVPLPQDDAIITNLATGTITMDMPRLGEDINFTGFVGTAAFSSTPNTLYGQIELASGMTISGTQTLMLSARSAKTITSNGKTFTQSISIAAPGGSYTLVDAFSLGTAGVLTLTAGMFDTANFAVTAVYFISLGTITRAAIFGTSTVTLTRTTAFPMWDVSGTGDTISAANAVLVASIATANARSFIGGGKTYGTLTYTVAGSTGSLTITGNNTFNTINFSDANNARSLLFTAGTTNTFTNFNVFGTSGKLMTIDTAGGVGTHTLVLAA